MQHTRHVMTHAQEGFILLTVTLLTAGLTILSTIGLTRSYTDLLASRSLITHTQALYGAEAAADTALVQLRADLLDGTWTVTDTGTIPTPGMTSHATITSLAPGGGASIANGDRLLITATSTPVVGDVPQPQFTRTIQAVVEAQAMWAYAFLGTGVSADQFTEDWNVLNESTMDSYDSSGPAVRYDSRDALSTAEMVDITTAVPSSNTDGQLALAGGSYVLNLTPHVFALDSKTTVYGSLAHAAAMPATVFVNAPPGAITGGLKTFAAIPATGIPPMPADLPAIGHLEIAQEGTGRWARYAAYADGKLIASSTGGQPLQVPLGTCVIGNLTITGSMDPTDPLMTVQIQNGGAPTTWYITGSVTAHGADVYPATNSGTELPPSYLQMIDAGAQNHETGSPDAVALYADSQTWSFTGGGRFSASVYAPEGTVVVGMVGNGPDTHFSGAIISKRLKMNHGHLHYDEELLKGLFYLHLHSWWEVTGTSNGP